MSHFKIICPMSGTPIGWWTNNINIYLIWSYYRFTKINTEGWMALLCLSVANVYIFHQDWSVLMELSLHCYYISITITRLHTVIYKCMYALGRHSNVKSAQERNPLIWLLISRWSGFLRLNIDHLKAKVFMSEVV